MPPPLRIKYLLGDDVGLWRRWDLNPQPRDYDALALPLSYLAKRARYYYGGAILSTKKDFAKKAHKLYFFGLRAGKE